MTKMWKHYTGLYFLQLFTHLPVGLSAPVTYHMFTGNSNTSDTCSHGTELPGYQPSIKVHDQTFLSNPVSIGIISRKRMELICKTFPIVDRSTRFNSFVGSFCLTCWQIRPRWSPGDGSGLGSHRHLQLPKLEREISQPGLRSLLCF